MKRFWDKVKKTDDCWEWQAHRIHNGYGQLRAGGRLVYAHRFSWVLHFGEIADGLHVLHTCDNRCCVKPDHLFLGTNADNIRDKIKKDRQARGSKSNRTKLTETDVIEILRLSKQGLSAVQIASLFPTSRQAVGDIIKGESWKHIDRSLVN